MKIRVLMVAVVFVVLFLITEILYAANGDLIVNGNLGVGTTTPTEKTEIKGNLKVSGTVTSGDQTVTGNQSVTGNQTVTGNETVNGNLCVGGNCTSTLHVSGGLYGRCFGAATFAGSCEQILSPAQCVPNPNIPGFAFCACPNGYTLSIIGVDVKGTSTLALKGYYYSCYKN